MHPTQPATRSFNFYSVNISFCTAKIAGVYVSVSSFLHFTSGSINGLSRHAQRCTIVILNGFTYVLVTNQFLVYLNNPLIWDMFGVSTVSP